MLVKLKSRYHGFIKVYNIPNKESLESKLSVAKVDTDIALLIAAIRNEKYIEPSTIKNVNNSDMLRVLINKKLVWVSGEDIDYVLNDY